jgi:hypothetical protein
MALEITKPEQILGRQVKLRIDQYKPDNWVQRFGWDWPGYELDIVVEIQGWLLDRRRRIDRVNKVGLAMYNRFGHLYTHNGRFEIPQLAVVGFSTNELTLIRADGRIQDDLL